MISDSYLGGGGGSTLGRYGDNFFLASIHKGTVSQDRIVHKKIPVIAGICYTVICLEASAWIYGAQTHHVTAPKHLTVSQTNLSSQDFEPVYVMYGVTSSVLV
jgi:hypothetical protein